MSVIITTHDASGHAIFSSKVPEEQHSFDIPIGKMTLLYSIRDLPANLSTEKDIDDFAFNRINGFGPGVPAPPGGMSAYIMQMAPGLGMPMRRLPAMGVFYVLEGQMTLHLDSGEAKTFRTGDAGVVRGVKPSMDERYAEWWVG